MRRLIYESGKNQSEIAREMRISVATLFSWATGTRIPRMDKIDMLCKYFRVERSVIMGEVKEAQTEEKQTGNPIIYYIDETMQKLDSDQLNRLAEYARLLAAENKE